VSLLNKRADPPPSPRVARSLRDGVPASQWRRAEQAAGEAAAGGHLLAAAGLYSSAADAAAQDGRPTDAVRLRCKASGAQAAAGDLAAAKETTGRSRSDLGAVTRPGEWVSAASLVNLQLVATGLVGESVALTEGMVTVADTLPAESDNELLVRAQARSLHASALSRMSRFRDALDVLSEARPLAPDHAHEVIGNIEYTTGLAHAELNEIRAARAAYSRARDAFNRGGDAVDLAYVDRVDGAALGRTGRFEEAVQAFERAKATFISEQMPAEVDRCEVGLLQAKFQLGDTTWTAAECDELEKVAARMSPAESVTMALNVANMALRQGDLVRAGRLMRSYLTVARDLGLNVDAARLQGGLALVLKDQGDIGGATRNNRQARVVFSRSGMLRETANADVNYALLLEESARALAAKDPAAAARLRGEAADSAIRAVQTLDNFRHSLPNATDRYQIVRRVYPHVFTVAISACLRVGRHDEAAALVERSRVQPVLGDTSQGYLEPRPVATRPGAPSVGGTGTSVFLSSLAGRVAPGATWVGWWTDEGRLVRCRSGPNATDVDNGELDATGLQRLALCLPLALDADLDACAGNQQQANLLALWRAASGPLVNDRRIRSVMSLLLPASIIRTVQKDPDISALAAMSADELLWPLTQNLFADHWRAELLAAANNETRLGLVVAPPPQLGRVPWAALPLTDPALGPVTHLVDVADIVVGLPASLGVGRPQPQTVAPPARSDHPGPGLLVSDSRGDLPWASRLRPHGYTVLGSTGAAAATRQQLASALATRPRSLVINGHVIPGTEIEPALAALVLVTADGAIDPMTVTDMRQLGVPPVCIILGCDGAGAAIGTEWTGLATGLIWAGAREVVTTTSPVIDDATTVQFDEALLAVIEEHGATEGLWTWQRTMASRHRADPQSPNHAPYRWAASVVLRAG